MVGTTGSGKTMLAKGPEWAILIPVAFAAGLAADLLRVRLRPSAERVGALRLLAFAVPSLYFAVCLGTVIAESGTWYTVHGVAGFTILPGVVGLGLSYLVVPPRVESGRS